MSGRLLRAAGGPAAAGLVLVVAACTAAAADAPARHCALLASEYETQGSPGAGVLDTLRGNTRLVQTQMLHHLQSDRLVANAFFVDVDGRAASNERMRRTSQRTGCDTVVEVRNLLLASAFGSAFGFDVVVQRIDGAAATTLYSRQYRYGFDKATLDRFSYAAFVDAAWADLRQSAVLDVDREASAVPPEAVRAEYDRLAASWPSNLIEYHLRQIVRPSFALASKTLERLREKDPPDFAVLAGTDSEDPGGATRGGDAGWVAPYAMPPSIAQAVQAHTGTGLLDVPIEINGHWLVIDVLGSRPAAVPTFDAVRDQVTAQLRWNAVVPAATWADALRP